MPRRRRDDAPAPELPIDLRPDRLADDARRTRRGTFELITATVVVLALIAFLVWFFAFAHNPCCAP